MSTQSSGAGTDITDLLVACGPAAMRDERLLRAVYKDLKAIARARRRKERGDLTLGTTDLVHESYLRLVDQERAAWEDRRHFYSVAAMMMRRVLVDHARRHLSARHGGGCEKVSLDRVGEAMGVDEQAELIVEVDDLLDRLGALHERLPAVVECRWFAGYGVRETAEILGVSERTVRSDWTKARALLRQGLSGA